MPTRPDSVSATRRLAADERGFTLVFFAVALPVLLGIVGLAVDVGRLYTLDSQLARVADSAAIAAASQLDHGADALPRARAAADGLGNRPSFADNADLGLSFRFASRLSDLRDSPTFSLADTDGAQAVYVEVATARRSLTASFMQFVGAGPAAFSRKAIAESQYHACDVTPLMLCQRDPALFAASAVRGRQYRFRNAPDMADGTLVTLDASGDGEGRATPARTASNRPDFCYVDGIRFRPGVAARQFDEAINVRFDRYATATGPVAPELAAFPPAPNVIKGQRYESCLSPPNAASVYPPYRLPRDSAFQRVTERTRYDDGTGDWKSALAYGGSGAAVASALEEYIFWNHADKTPIFQGSLRAAQSRYELYLRELGLTEASEATRVVTQGNSLAATLPTGGPRAGSYASLSEPPAPVCYRGSEPANEARRRILYVAIADCANFSRDGTATRLSRRVGKFFLTEPANAGVVMLEFVNMLTPAADDGKLRHVVRLVQTE